MSCSVLLRKSEIICSNIFELNAMNKTHLSISSAQRTYHSSININICIHTSTSRFIHYSPHSFVRSLGCSFTFAEEARVTGRPSPFHILERSWALLPWGPPAELLLPSDGIVRMRKFYRRSPSHPVAAFRRALPGLLPLPRGYNLHKLCRIAAPPAV